MVFPGPIPVENIAAAEVEVGNIKYLANVVHEGPVGGNDAATVVVELGVLALALLTEMQSDLTIVVYEAPVDGLQTRKLRLNGILIVQLLSRI